MPRQRGATAAGEQPEAVVQPRGHLLGRHGPHPGGGQLDGQGQAVEPPADRDDGADGLVVDGERRLDGGGPVDEQPDRGVRHGLLGGAADRRQRRAAGDGQSVSPVMPSGSRLVASSRTPGQSARTWSASSAIAAIRCSQLSRTISSSAPERASTSRAIASVVSSIAPRPQLARPVEQAAFAQAERREDGLRQVERFVHRSQLDQPDAAGQLGLEPVAGLQRQAGLAGPTGTDQGDQTRGAERGADLLDLALAADEAGQGRAQVAVPVGDRAASPGPAEAPRGGSAPAQARDRRRARRRAGDGSGRRPRARRPGGLRRRAPGSARPAGARAADGPGRRPRARPGRGSRRRPAEPRQPSSVSASRTCSRAGPAAAAYGGSPMSASTGPRKSERPSRAARRAPSRSPAARAARVRGTQVLGQQGVDVGPVHGELVAGRHARRRRPPPRASPPRGRGAGGRPGCAGRWCSGPPRPRGHRRGCRRARSRRPRAPAGPAARGRGRRGSRPAARIGPGPRPGRGAAPSGSCPHGPARPPRSRRTCSPPAALLPESRLRARNVPSPTGLTGVRRAKGSTAGGAGPPATQPRWSPVRNDRTTGPAAIAPLLPVSTKAANATLPCQPTSQAWVGGGELLPNSAVPVFA